MFKKIDRATNNRRALVASLVLAVLVLLLGLPLPRAQAYYAQNLPLPISTNQFLDSMYTGVLGRIVQVFDHNQRQSYLDQLSNRSISLEQLYHDYFDKADLEKPQGLAVQDFLDRAFRCVLFHKPSQAEIEEWVDLSPYYSRSEMLDLFLYSYEFVKNIKPHLLALKYSALQSSFFKDDPTAIKIVTDQLSDYDINNFTLVAGEGPASTAPFAYKVIRGILQVGYSPNLNQFAGLRPGFQIVRKYQFLNNLPRNNPLVVTRDLLLSLDAKLVTSEAQDSIRGPSFPLYPMITEPPINEPSREHYSRLLNTALTSLPPHLYLNTEDNFYSFFGNQLPSYLAFLNGAPTATICDPGYYPEFGGDCVFLGSQVSVLLSEFETMSLWLHEYAHWLDGNLYYQDFRMVRGSISTTDFYNISYDTSLGVTGLFGHPAYQLRRGAAAKSSEFVSSYAVGYVTDDIYWTPYEDFAESFALYVTGGEVFRTLASQNSVLQWKYDWLKTNVFNGTQFQSGVAGNIDRLRAQPTSPGNFGGAFNIADYWRVNSNLVFDYDYHPYEK